MTAHTPAKFHPFLWSAAALVLATGCAKEPPCKAGELAAEWKKDPLSKQVPQGEVTICEGSTATDAKFWVEKKVHDANIASVDRAQNTGWSRTSDNWYGSSGNFHTPKWSEFKSKDGKLRVDVKEVNGGALITVKHTPGG